MTKNILNGLLFDKFLQNYFYIWNIFRNFAARYNLRAREPCRLFDDPIG